MPAKLKIRKGDAVVVVSGKDKGRKGEVLSVIPKENRAVVRGVNVVRRHQRQTQTQEGGIVRKELPTWRSRIPRTVSRPVSATGL